MRFLGLASKPTDTRGVSPSGRWGNRVCRLIGLVGVVFFLVTAFSPLAPRANQWLANPPQLVPSDAIVVLGGWVSPSGLLSLESLPRARPLFERAGFEVHTAPSDSLVEADEPESRLALMRVLVKECLGWLYYRVAGYI